MPRNNDAHLTLHCPAKVNLALSVGPPQPDGLHPIASWMIALTFGDQLNLRRTTNETSTWQTTFDQDAPQPQPVNWPLERDLAWRAHRLLAERMAQPLAVAVKLNKRVPTGAGLGGGSSNAAAMLVGLNQLFQLKQSQAELTELAKQLGSDVAFLVAALHGKTSAIVTGTGEQIEPAPLAKPVHLTLILPPFSCPTGPVYQAFDAMHPHHAPHHAALREPAVRALAKQSPLQPESPFNDLAEPAKQVQPALGEAVHRLRETLNWPVHVTGSGAAMFAIARSASHAHELAQQITHATKLPAVATQTHSA